MTPDEAQAQLGAEATVLRLLATTVQLLALRPGRLTQNMLWSGRTTSYTTIIRYHIDYVILII